VIVQAFSLKIVLVKNFLNDILCGVKKIVAQISKNPAIKPNLID